MLAVTFADLWFRARQFLIAIVGCRAGSCAGARYERVGGRFPRRSGVTVDAVGATSWVMSPSAQGRLTAFAAFPEPLPALWRASLASTGPPRVVRSRAGGPRPGVDGSADRQPHGCAARRVGGSPGGVRSLAVGPRVRLSSTPRLQAPVGSVLELGGHPYDVVGVVDDRTMDGGIPIVYMPLATVQQAVTGGRPLITAVATMGTPATVPAGLVVLTPTAVVTDTVTAFGSAVTSIDNTRSLMWVIAAAIVGVHALRRRAGAEARFRRTQGSRILVAARYSSASSWRRWWSPSSPPFWPRSCRSSWDRSSPRR